MRNILFIGTYLSSKTGTTDIAETVSQKMNNHGFNIILISHFENKILRMTHIIWCILFYNYEKIFFDVFSDKAFQITRIGSYFARLRNKKIIYNLRGGRLANFSNSNLKLVKKVFSRANHIQSPSNYLISYFKKMGFKVNYLPNPIKLEYFVYDRKNVEPYSILWVRAFSQIYNPEIAIKIVEELKKDYPEVSMTMIGPDKGMLKKIKQQILNLNLSNNIKILGPISNKKLSYYYQRHNVFVNTTSYESFGTALIEAASCGIPIVSTNVGEIPLNWTNEKDILLVENFSEIEFRHKISMIFDKPDFSKIISKNARKNINKYDWNLLESEWLKILNEE